MKNAKMKIGDIVKVVEYKDTKCSETCSDRVAARAYRDISGREGIIIGTAESNSRKKIVFIKNIDGKVADYFYVHEKFLEKIGKMDNINTEKYWDIVEPWDHRGPKKLVGPKRL